MKNEKLQNMLRFFKALADESRLKIIGILATQECSVEELAVLLELAILNHTNFNPLNIFVKPRTNP